jgi:hypothetical protein
VRQYPHQVVLYIITGTGLNRSFLRHPFPFDNRRYHRLASE